MEYGLRITERLAQGFVGFVEFVALVGFVEFVGDQCAVTKGMKQWRSPHHVSLITRYCLLTVDC